MSQPVLVVGGLGFPVPEGWHVDRAEGDEASAEVVLVFPVAVGAVGAALSMKPVQTFMGSVLVEFKRRPEPVELERWVQDSVTGFMNAQPTSKPISQVPAEVAGLAAIAREHVFTGPGNPVEIPVPLPGSNTNIP